METRNKEKVFKMLQLELGDEVTQVIRLFVDAYLQFENCRDDSLMTIDQWFVKEIVGMAAFYRYWKEREGVDNFPKYAFSGEFDEQYEMYVLKDKAEIGEFYGDAE